MRFRGCLPSGQSATAMRACAPASSVAGPRSPGQGAVGWAEGKRHGPVSATSPGWAGPLQAPAATGMSSRLKVRSQRRSRVKANHQPKMAPMRLRQPVRKPMWMNSQPSQPKEPPNWILPTEMTARPREMQAAEPGTTVAQLPEPRPQPAAQEPEPRCQASTGLAHRGPLPSRSQNRTSRGQWVIAQVAPISLTCGSGWS